MSTKLALSILGLLLVITIAYQHGYTQNEVTPISDLVYYEINSEDGFNEESDGQFNWEETKQKSSNKSGLKAAMLSALLPGAGEYYLDNKSRAAFFFGTEALIWGGFFAFRIYGNWLEDDYKNYAQVYAGINPEGKDDEFFDNLQFYVSRDWYNTIEGLPFGEAYPYTDDYYWHWESLESQDRYRDIRNSSKRAFRNSSFMVGVALVNRLVSITDAIYLSRQQEEEDEFDFFSGWKLDYDANLFSKNPEASVKLIKSFN
ncbi:MAG: hypothetical protein GF315_10785 [candidate division Zixibacteria bacterium]|nr:hypothetical protein [candidate division Zixibacteria bacterium]